MMYVAAVWRSLVAGGLEFAFGASLTKPERKEDSSNGLKRPMLAADKSAKSRTSSGSCSCNLAADHATLLSVWGSPASPPSTASRALHSARSSRVHVGWERAMERWHETAAPSLA